MICNYVHHGSALCTCMHYGHAEGRNTSIFMFEMELDLSEFELGLFENELLKIEFALGLVEFDLDLS